MKAGGAAFGGLVVGSGEIAALDAKIQELNAEVLAAPVDALTPGFRLDWTAYVLRWIPWRDSHNSFLAQSGIPNLESGIDPHVGADFDLFGSNFNELRRQFKALGGSTATTEQAHSDGPIGDAVDKIAGAATTIAEVALVVGGVVGLAILLSRSRK